MTLLLLGTESLPIGYGGHPGDVEGGSAHEEVRRRCLVCISLGLWAGGRPTRWRAGVHENSLKVLFWIVLVVGLNGQPGLPGENGSPSVISVVYVRLLLMTCFMEVLSQPSAV